MAGDDASANLANLNQWLESVKQDEEADLMESLEQEEEELRAMALPRVDLLASEHGQKIAGSRDEIRKGLAKDYLFDFERTLDDRKLKIASVPKKVLRQKVAAIQAKGKRDRDHLDEHFASEQADLASQEKDARARVVQLQTQREQGLHAQRASLHAQARAMEPRLRRAFRQREGFLRAALAKQKAKVLEDHGRLKADLSYDSRRLVVDGSDHVPRQTVVHVELLQGAKDKVPKGTYVLGVYLLEALGGARLCYAKSRATAADMPPTSKPFPHAGTFSSVSTVVGDAVGVTCPSAAETDASNVYILELYAVSDEDHANVLAAVGWTALPVCTASAGEAGAGTLCHGSFRLPLVKGPYGAHFDRYFKLEQAICADLDKWLCNLYVRVEALPVRAPPGSTGSSEPLASRPLASATNSSQVDFAKEAAVLVPGGIAHAAKDGKDKGSKGKGWTMPWRRLHRGVVVPDPSEHSEHPASKDKGESTLLKAALAPEQRVTEEDEALDAHRYAVKSTSGSRRHRGAAIHQLHYLWEDAKGLWPRVRGTKRRRWAPNDACVLLASVALAFYVRMLAHYLGQHLYLRGGGFGAVFGFHILPYKCIVKFSHTHMPLFHLVNLVVVGAAACLAAFVCFALLAVLLQRASGHVPAALMRFVCFVGLFAALDPLVTLVVDLGANGLRDCAHHCADVAGGVYAAECLCGEAELLRVAWHFRRVEGSVLNAVYLLSLVVSACAAASALAVVVFFVFLHKHGRAHDLYRRLHHGEEAFFVPKDTEVSQTYLEAVRHRARHWKGPHAATRRVRVSTHEERTVVDIVQRDADGAEQTWRSFVRTHSDGTIVERIS